MSTSPTGTRPSADQLRGSTVLTGTPVVPGVALGPVVRPIGAIELPATEGPRVPEDAAGRGEGPVLRRGRRRGGAADGTRGGGHRGERRGADHDRAARP